MCVRVCVCVCVCVTIAYSNHPAFLTLQVIPLHMLVLPTSALTDTSSSPVITNTRLTCVVDGVPVHDGRKFAIDDRSLTLMDVSQSRYAERETMFQCCMKLTSGPQVCGEHYIFDPPG